MVYLNDQKVASLTAAIILAVFSLHLLSIHRHYTNNPNTYTDYSKFKAIDKRGREDLQGSRRQGGVIGGTCERMARCS